jgi:4-alpha-glucanotransferase
MGKTCFKCGEWKSFSEFYKHKKRLDGHQTWCKLCRKAHYKANKEQANEYQREHYSLNKDWIREHQKEY